VIPNKAGELEMESLAMATNTRAFRGKVPSVAKKGWEKAWGGFPR
jgi:hypothetical protein